MTHGWTPERRAKQAEAIKRWQPWLNSTGAVTQAGKDKSKMNAYKGGRTERGRRIQLIARLAKHFKRNFLIDRAAIARGEALDYEAYNAILKQLDEL